MPAVVPSEKLLVVVVAAVLVLSVSPSRISNSSCAKANGGLCYPSRTLDAKMPAAPNENNPLARSNCFGNIYVIDTGFIEQRRLN